MKATLTINGITIIVHGDTKEELKANIDKTLRDNPQEDKIQKIKTPDLFGK